MPSFETDDSQILRRVFLEGSHVHILNVKTISGSDLANNALIKERYGLLSSAASRVASPQIRNVAP